MLLSPAIFAQNYPLVKSNDEPFLPISPQYSYNLKLTKRGIDRQGITQLTPELYNPKTDSADSYNQGFNNNFQKDSYFPSYNVLPKPAPGIPPYFPPAPFSPGASPYGPLNSPYPSPYAGTSPYAGAGPYPAGPSPGPYAPGPSPGPYPPGPYPNYSPYYPGAPTPYAGYPGYQPYNPYYPPPPPPPYPQSSKDDDDSDDDDKEDGKRSEGKRNRYKESNDIKYVNNGNYISDNSKDLDGQSSSYKTPSNYNNLDSGSQQKTLYRIVNIPSQQSSDILLSTNQAKAHLENLMRQALTKILSQNVIQNVPQPVPRISYPFDLESNKNNQNYVTTPGQGIAKTGLTYIVNPTVYTKVNQGQNNANLQAQGTIAKNVKYPNPQYGQKPVTKVTLERSPGVYLSPYKSSTQSPDYADYDSPQSNLGDRDANQDQPHDSASYSSQNVVTAKAPEAFSYQYSSYHSDQSSDQIEPDKDSTEDLESKEKSSR